MTQYQTLKALLDRLNNLGVPQCYLVGGCVRDAYLHGGGQLDFEHESIKDFDVECFNVYPEELESKLVTCCGALVDKVGASFGVFKVTYKGFTFDFSFPRRELKSGEGYKGFEVVIDIDMSIPEAASRRDLTINAIYYSTTLGTYIDPFFGMLDLANRMLRPVSDRFAEDPLRVLRAFQFVARFGFRADYRLSKMCLDLLPEKSTLVKERVWVEWEKWCTKSTHPSKGLWFLLGCRWLDTELEDLVGVAQDPTWHPEGSCFIHTCHVVDVMNEMVQSLDKDDKIILMLAALCHDVGKATTTIFEAGKWKAPGHAEAGVEIAARFLLGIGCPTKYIPPILTLVKEHMSHLGAVTPRVCRRLVNRLVEGGTSLQMLSNLVEADASGRPPRPKCMPENMLKLLELAEDLEIDGSVKIPQLLMGRDLIELGVAPGPGMGVILNQVYQKQLDGDFETKEEALTFVKTLIQ